MRGIRCGPEACGHLSVRVRHGLQDSPIVWSEEFCERRRDCKPDQHHRDEQLPLQAAKAHVAPVQQYERAHCDDTPVCGGRQVASVASNVRVGNPALREELDELSECHEDECPPREQLVGAELVCHPPQSSAQQKQATQAGDVDSSAVAQSGMGDDVEHHQQR